MRRLLTWIALIALAAPSAASAADERALERRLGPQAVVEIDERTGTPRVLARLDGTLTGPSADDPEDVALRYVRANRAALGLRAADLDALRPPEVTEAGAITTVRWRQAHEGIPVADAELRVNLTRDGRVLNVLGAPESGLRPATTPRISAAAAVRAVAGRSLTPERGPTGRTRATTFTDGSTAKLRIYKGRLTWRVLYEESSQAVYDAFVDAESGRVLKRANMVKSAANALVWERHPGAPSGGTPTTRDLEALGYLPAGATSLNGPYVLAFSDLDDDDELDPGEAVGRTGGSFQYAFNARTTGSNGCSVTFPCSWTFGGPANNWSANRAQNAVQAFYYANRFREHLASPPINFTTGGFAGVDKLVLHTNDGASTGPDANHRNNANMFTPPDGIAPRMQMYLWGGTLFRDVNGGDDAAILYHEYTHGMTSRLVTDADGFGALDSAQAGAMGEGWSDFYAMDFLVANGYQADTAAVDVRMGAYADLTGTTIRTEPLDCHVGAPAGSCPGAGTAGSGGYTYGDFGKIGDGPQVHDDGEIWAQTLWDLRAAIDSDAARGLITQALRISPPEPSFLDMRNAILQADQAEGAPNRAWIWAVFANRGMGFFASTIDGDDATPVEDFTLPPTGPFGRIAGDVRDIVTGAPLPGASAAIGGLANGPDARAATAGADGGFAIESVPAGTYRNVIYSSPGYDRLIAPATVAAGQTAAVAPRLRRNWSALSGGASVVGDDRFANIGCGPKAALDQRSGTGWSTSNTAGTNSMVITLPQAVDIERFRVDPSETCGDEQDSQTREIRIETAPSPSGPFTVAATHAFGLGVAPTDIAPTAGAGNVRAVRVTLLSNYGGPYRDLSEFGVYGSPTPPPPAPPPPQPAPRQPSFTLPKSGKKGALKFKVKCELPCAVSAQLRVSKVTGKRIGLGKSRIAGQVKRRTVKAGTRTLTLKVPKKVIRTLKRKKLKSFRATLKVTASYAGSRAVTRSRLLTVRR